MNEMVPVINARAGGCQEASHLSSSYYIPCNAPARKVVLADGKETPMCNACAHHSEKNRAMKICREYGTIDGEILLPDAIGHNSPPDPIDEATAPFGDDIAEAEGWLDGSPVENEAQMKAVDKLLKSVKAAKKAVTDAEESAAKPIYDAWKAEKAKFAPTITDLDRIAKGLVAITDSFKRKLAAEKAEATRLAQAAAWEATRKAQEAARLADAANIEQQREAAAAMDAAKEAQRVAMAASKDTVKGLRTVTHHAIDDHKTLLNAIAKDHRDDVTAFIEAWAQKNHKQFPNTAGLRVWTTKEAF